MKSDHISQGYTQSILKNIQEWKTTKFLQNRYCCDCTHSKKCLLVCVLELLLFHFAPNFSHSPK